MTNYGHQSRNRTHSATTGFGAGLTVWSRIVAELAQQQDAATQKVRGPVVNPVCGKPYIFDTCCAAKVFAAEYHRTADQRWRERAEDALAAVQIKTLFSGIAEPAWDALGWHDEPQSLPPTGMAADTYWGALDLLGLDAEDHSGILLDLLSRCRTKAGGFAHNAVNGGKEPPDVQNATASALNIMARMARHKNAVAHPVYAGKEAALLRLSRGQSASGFWPYYYPGTRLKEALDRRPFSIPLRPRRFFLYHRSGDIMHHLMTLYFAAAYFLSSGNRSHIEMLSHAWDWIRKCFVEGGNGGLSIDWRTDPVPERPRFSNARDTNAYFLLLALIPRLSTLGIVDSDETDSVADRLLTHVSSRLMAEPGKAPCITPCEGPREIVRNLLPMFEQSAAWKGCLMSEIILARSKAG